MKIMTYNLLNGAVDQFNEVIQVVNTEKPDFLTLNEANGFDVDNNKRLLEFASKTHFPYHRLAICGDGDSYHVAVFSRLPFKSVNTISPFARAAIVAIVDTPTGEIVFIGTHLTPYTEDLRIPEAKMIIETLKNYPKSIVMGDLNSLSPSDGYDEAMVNGFNDMQIKKFTTQGKLRYDVMNLFLENGFIDTAVLFGKQRIITAPTSLNEYEAHTNMRLDYILTSGSLKDRVKTYDVIQNGLTDKSSDHYPVAITLG